MNYNLERAAEWAAEMAAKRAAQEREAARAAEWAAWAESDDGKRRLSRAREIAGLSPEAFKVLENRLRRMAARQGLSIVKSRRRDPWARDYGQYMIFTDENYVVAGGDPIPFGLDLESVEDFLLHGFDNA